MTVKLSDPFEPGDIGKLPKLNCRACSDSKGRGCDKHKVSKCKECGNWLSSAHIHLDYVGHAHVTERLLKVDPDWSWEPMATDANGLPQLDGSGGLWIRLTVNGVTRPGYGDADGKRGGNAVKEAIGDAIRNAAMRFGVALDLWKKDKPEPVGPPRRDDKPVKPAAAEEQPRTEEQIRAGLRNKVMEMHRRRGWSLSSGFADFMEWSQGTEFKDATTEMLQQYVDALVKQEAS